MTQPTFDKSHPILSVVGVSLRALALASMAVMLGTYASFIAGTEGISTDLGRYRAWVFLTPALAALGSALLATRTTYWLVRGMLASDRQFVSWRRGVPLEIITTGVGGFCVMLGNVPGMAWDLGPLGAILVLIGLAFVANPQATLIDGERGRIVVSGVLYAAVVPFTSAVIAPLCIVTRNRGGQSWHLGLNSMDISPEITRDEAFGLAAWVVARTGAPTRTTAASLGGSTRAFNP